MKKLFFMLIAACFVSCTIPAENKIIIVQPGKNAHKTDVIFLPDSIVLHNYVMSHRAEEELK